MVPRPRTAYLLTPAFMLLLVAACPRWTSFTRPPKQEPAFLGHYTRSFGARVFEPCGADEQEVWMVVLSDKAHFQLSHPSGQADAVPGRRSFVRLRGRVQPGGPHGPLGYYTCVIEVSEVENVAPEGPDDCANATTRND